MEDAAWRVAVDKVLKGAAFDTLVSCTHDGIEIQPLYMASQGDNRTLWRDAGRPMGVLQRVDHPDPAEANRLARADVSNGATGLVLVLAGSVAARGHGLGVRSADDLSAIVDGIALEGLALRLELPRADAGGAVDAVADFLSQRGTAFRSLDLDWGQDATAGRETLLPKREREPAEPLFQSVFRADGRSTHEAGGSEAQELAAVLDAGVAALRALEPSGLEAARDALSFTLVADADQMLTIAKFRALRRLWARIEEACGLTPKPIRLHAETAWRMLTRRDPHTNLLRNTIAAAAAILGGADSLTVLPHTSALGLPDELARRLARNTPLVLLEEAHLGGVADPAAGSGAFEAVTEALCLEAWDLFQDLEREGGLAAALAHGGWAARIAESGAARARDLRSGRTVIVGVTHFEQAEALGPPLVAREQSDALASMRDEEAYEAVS